MNESYGGKYLEILVTCSAWYFDIYIFFMVLFFFYILELERQVMLIETY